MKKSWKIIVLVISLLIIGVIAYFLRHPKPEETAVAIRDVPRAKLVLEEDDRLYLHLEEVRYTAVGMAARDSVMKDTLRGYSIDDGRFYQYYYSFNELDPSEYLAAFSKDDLAPLASGEEGIMIYQATSAKEMPEALQKIMKSYQDRDSEEVMQIVKDIRDYVAPALKNEPIDNKGRIEVNDDRNAGCTEFVCGTYHFFYNPGFREIMAISSDAKSDAAEKAEKPDAVRERADGLFILVKGKKLLENCTVRTESNEAGLHFYYDYKMDDKTLISAGLIDCLDSGEITEAVFGIIALPAEK